MQKALARAMTELVHSSSDYQSARDASEVLFGKVNPSGHLPVTFYRATADLPGFTDYSMSNRTYRYFGGAPLFAFGHGLRMCFYECMGGTKRGLGIERRARKKCHIQGATSGRQKGVRKNEAQVASFKAQKIKNSPKQQNSLLNGSLPRLCGRCIGLSVIFDADRQRAFARKHINKALPP